MILMISLGRKDQHSFSNVLMYPITIVSTFSFVNILLQFGDRKRLKILIIDPLNDDNIAMMKINVKGVER